MKFKIRFISILIFAFLVFSILAPADVYAKPNFRKFVRNLRRGSSFIINLPNRATRFLGPTLGPIAADIISVNLGKNPRFGSFLNKARRIEKITGNIEEQNQLINDLRKIYTDQASQLRTQADSVRTTRRDLAQQLIKGDITLQQHFDQVADLEAIAQVYESAADKLDRSASRLNPSHIIKLVGSNFANTSLIKIQNLVKNEISTELNRFLNPNIIKNIISSGDGLDSLLQIILSDDLEALKNNPRFDFDQFKDQLLQKIRQMLQDDKDALKNNWQQTMQTLIQEEIKQVQLTDVPSLTPKPESNNSQSADLPKPQKDEHGCLPGYIWHPRSGVGCVQKDCYQGHIPHAHLGYDGHCVCGSSGSINENLQDPNKECFYDSSFASCPGCVYACVHLDQDCPETP